jgi:spermidine synthase
MEYKHVVQNRSGIIAVADDPASDIIYGGGVYDGRFNVDIAHHRNGIDRAYLMAALHRDPEKILVIGLSSGSWVWVLGHYEPARTIDVVEINPGYPTLVEKYSGSRSSHGTKRS